MYRSLVLALLLFSASNGSAQVLPVFEPNVTLFTGGPCGPTTIGSIVILGNTRDDIGLRIDVEIRTMSFMPDIVQVERFIVPPETEIEIGCTWPDVGVSRSFRVTDSEIDCDPFLFMWCPDTGQPSSFVDGCDVQINGATHFLCGPSPLDSLWNWDDGSSPPPQFWPVQHRYTRNGVYDVSVSNGPFFEQCQVNVTNCFPPDIDDDGIENGIDGMIDGVFQDQSAEFSNHFTDRHLGGTTQGTIFNRAGNELLITDDASFGVVIAASGPGTSLVQMCGPSNLDIFNLLLDDGDEIGVTCGSLNAEVRRGPVTITVGVNVQIIVPAGARAFMQQLPGALVSISNISRPGAADIVIEDDSGVQNLGPNDPSVIIAVNDGLPEVPTDVRGRAKPGVVNLVWTPVEADSYDVFRSNMTGGPYVLIGSVNGRVFVDSDVTNGETYFYVVQAVGQAGSSENSNEAEVPVPTGRKRR